MREEAGHDEVRTPVSACDAIGGLGDIVSSGDRVAIKVNLTGGTSVQPLRGVSAIESYITHPEVVRALGQLLRDAGARELLIVEAVYEWASYVEWGYVDIADAIGAQLIDLNDTDPYNDFSETAVGEGSFIYDRLLEFGKEYSLNLSSSAKALEGGLLKDGLVWHFYTVFSPAIVSVTPTNGQVQNYYSDQFVIEFASPMDQKTRHMDMSGLLLLGP